MTFYFFTKQTHMKARLILSLMLVLSLLFVNAQKTENKLRVAGGVSLYQGETHEHFELGSTNGVNTWAVVGETFDNDAYDDRQWYAGIKYLHQTPIGGTADFVVGGEALIHLTNEKDIMFKPIAGIQLNLGKNVGVLGTIAVPIADNTTPFKPITLQAGAGIVLKL